MDAKSSSERREHERAEIEARVSCRGAEPRSLLALRAEIVSVGGVLLRSDVALASGESVTLELSLPDGFVPAAKGPLQLRGHVVRVDGSKPYGLVVQFLELGESEEEVLSKYVRRKNLIGRR
jgi:hypothetical protein